MLLPYAFSYCSAVHQDAFEIFGDVDALMDMYEAARQRPGGEGAEGQEGEEGAEEEEEFADGDDEDEEAAEARRQKRQQRQRDKTYRQAMKVGSGGGGWGLGWGT